jgi:hypothetical protein
MVKAVIWWYAIQGFFGLRPRKVNFGASCKNIAPNCPRSHQRRGRETPAEGCIHTFHWHLACLSRVCVRPRDGRKQHASINLPAVDSTLIITIKPPSFHHHHEVSDSLVCSHHLWQAAAFGWGGHARVLWKHWLSWFP